MCALYELMFVVLAKSNKPTLYTTWLALHCIGFIERNESRSLPDVYDCESIFNKRFPLILGVSTNNNLSHSSSSTISNSRVPKYCHQLVLTNKQWFVLILSFHFSHLHLTCILIRRRSTMTNLIFKSSFLLWALKDDHTA